MEKKTASICTEDLKKHFRSLKYSTKVLSPKLRRIRKISRWVLVILALIVTILFCAYNFVFENYEVIGESLECTTNTPFQFNYTCKLEIKENNTQYWSFESAFPDGLSIPHMMARVSTYHWTHGEYKAVFLKNTTIDVCEYSGGPFSKLFISIFLPDMIEKSNFNRPCPFSGAIYMRRFQFRRSLKLPRVVPGKWLIEFQFYMNEVKELTFTVLVKVEIRPIGWHLFEFELN